MTARIRFYRGLNDSLPQERRGRDFCAVCARAATTTHMIETLGVSHTEVASVLINEERCGFDKMLREGDVGSVYPARTGALMTACKHARRGRDRPPIADAHRGGLARMLRMAGFDTLYDHHYDDPDITPSPRVNSASH